MSQLIGAEIAFAMNPIVISLSTIITSTWSCTEIPSFPEKYFILAS